MCSNRPLLFINCVTLLLSFGTIFIEPVALAQDSMRGSGTSAASHGDAVETTRSWKLRYSTPNVKQVESVCIYRDKNTASFFSAGQWRATLAPEPGESCELLAADMRTRTVFLAVPGFNRAGEYLNGRADAYGCQSMSDLPQRYSICNSEFFQTDPSIGSSLRKLNTFVIETAVRESNLVALLNQRAEALQVEEEADERARMARAHERYLSDAADAKDLNAIALFEEHYSGDDPDGLLPQVLARRPALELKRYRDAYKDASDEASLRSFIARYAQLDPDHVIDSAKKKLAALERRNAEKVRAADNAKMIGQLEGKIRWCRHQLAGANATIGRERRIAQVSGYENKLTLRQAGELIVYCEEDIPANYARYQKLGGKLNLDAID